MRLLYTQKIIHRLGVFQGHDLVLCYAFISSHPFRHYLQLLFRLESRNDSLLAE